MTAARGGAPFAELSGTRALVTGASKGIGLATARLLAASGAWVGMVARTKDVLEDAAADVGGHPFAVDVSEADAVARLADRYGEAAGGPPDVVVCAAGAFSLAPVAETDPADLERQIAANLVAPFLVVRAFLPGMLERRAGHLVNIGSVAGRVPLPGNGAYSASKYGLRGLHEVLSEEVRGTGVRATLIEPSATDTALWDPLDPDGRPDLPSRVDMLRPEDVARAVLFAVAQPAGVELSHVAIRRNG